MNAGKRNQKINHKDTKSTKKSLLCVHCAFVSLW
jgi:hypothetical protein